MTPLDQACRRLVHLLEMLPICVGWTARINLANLSPSQHSKQFSYLFALVLRGVSELCMRKKRVKDPEICVTKGGRILGKIK